MAYVPKYLTKTLGRGGKFVYTYPKKAPWHAKYTAVKPTRANGYSYAVKNVGYSKQMVGTKQVRHPKYGPAISERNLNFWRAADGTTKASWSRDTGVLGEVRFGQVYGNVTKSSQGRLDRFFTSWGGRRGYV